jgi:hypothetical protein
MRHLGPAPTNVVDGSGRPAFGSFQGPLPPIDYRALGISRLALAAKHKRWMYVSIAAEDAFLGLAIVDLGYLMNGLGYALQGTELAVDRSVLAPPPLGGVNHTSCGGHLARLHMGASFLRVERPDGESYYDVEVELPELQIRARMETEGAPSPISVVAAIPGGIVNSTEKRALLRVTGEARIRGVKKSLDGALGGFDYTNGLLARHTQWRWAFAMGRARSGERVGLNLVEGFVGEGECALWVDDALFPLSEGRFTFDRDRPNDTWRVRTDDGAVDLEFTPRGIHFEKKNYGIVSSFFLQPIGVYRGKIRVPDGRVLELEEVFGVTEDQEILW